MTQRRDRTAPHRRRRLAGAILGAGIVLGFLSPAFAQEFIDKDDAARQFKERKRELDSVREKEAALARDVEALAKERARLNEQLIATARRVQESEAELTAIEVRLRQLSIQQGHVRTSIDDRREAISKLLAAMQRIGSEPPPAIITHRDDALPMVRSAMLLATIFPELKFQAESLSEDLKDLVRLGETIRRERDAQRAENQKLEAERARLAQLVDEKKRRLALSQTELTRIREAAKRHAGEVRYLGELVQRMEKELARSLQQYNRELAEAMERKRREIAEAKERERLALEAARERERLAREAAAERERLALEEAKKRERLALEAAKKAEERERLAREAELERQRLAREAEMERQRLAREAAAERERLAREAAAERERLEREAEEERKRLALEEAKERERLARPVEIKPDENKKVAFLSPGRIKPAIPFDEATGSLPRPVRGEAVLRFGDPEKHGRPSEGEWLKTRKDAQVTSPADGWVVYAGEFRSYGQLLIINTGGGYHVLLAGMKRIDVEVGQFVLASEPVAVMGAVTSEKGTKVGDDDRPLLYIEFRKDGRPINPAPWWADTPEKVQG